VLCRCYTLSAYVGMLRSRTLRSRVRVSTPDGAPGSRLPALLALPHPQPVLRTIFARGSLWAWRFGRLQRARDTRERFNREQKRGRRRENRLRQSRRSRRGPSPRRLPQALRRACRGLDDPGFWRLKLPLIGFLRSSPLWSFQKFASGRLATPGSTSLNVTFASA
jgi:hypothetical protein